MDMENVIEIEVDAEQAKQGLSAYEVYLENGGTLSEVDWLASLKGEPGKDGQDGKDGKDGEQGPQGVPGSIKIIPVTELPTENIDTTAIYLIPSEEPDDENQYKEVVYINGKWEPFGNGGAKVDLTGYATEEYVDDSLSNIGTYTPLSVNTDMRNLPTGTYGNIGNEVIELTFAERGETLGFLTPGELCWWINQTDNNNRTLVIPRGNMDPNYEFGSQLELAIYYATDDEGFQGALCSGEIMNTAMDYYILGRHEYQTLPVTETIPMEDNEFVNKRYVDSKIIGNAPTYVIRKANSTPWYPNGDYPTNSYNTSNGPEVQAIIQEVYDAGYDAFNIVMFDGALAYFFQHSFGLVQNKPTSITLEAHHMGTNGVEMPVITDMNIMLQWSNNIAAVSSVRVQSKKLVSRLDTQYLNKTNTTSFTPTGDYHPATKKYVDDSISENSIMTVEVNLQNNNNVSSGDQITIISDLINRLRAKNSPSAMFILTNTASSFNVTTMMSSINNKMINEDQTSYQFAGVMNTPGSAFYPSLQGLLMYVDGAWTDGVFTATRVQLNKSSYNAGYVGVDTAMSDTSTNTVRNSVIKKYVDNAISTAITTSLEASY